MDSPGGAYGATRSKTIACSYAYRNQPVVGPICGTAQNKTTYGANDWLTNMQYNGSGGATTVGPPYTNREVPQRMWDNGSCITNGGFYGSASYIDNAQRGAAALLDWPWPSCYRKSTRILGGRAIMADRWGKCNTNNVNPWLPDPYPGDGVLAHKDGYNVLYGDFGVRWMGDPQQQFIWRHHGGTGNYQVNASSINLWVFPGVTEWKFFDRFAGLDTNSVIYQAFDTPNVQ